MLELLFSGKKVSAKICGNILFAWYLPLVRLIFEPAETFTHVHPWLNSMVQRLEEEKQSLLRALKLSQKQTVESESLKKVQDLENENKSLLATLGILSNESSDVTQHKWSTLKRKRNYKPQTKIATYGEQQYSILVIVMI